MNIESKKMMMMVIVVVVMIIKQLLSISIVVGCYEMVLWYRHRELATDFFLFCMIYYTYMCVCVANKI